MNISDITLDVDYAIEKIKDIVVEKFESDVDDFYEDPEFVFYPYKKAWKGHNYAINKIVKGSKRKKLLLAPTGCGKTVIALTSIAEKGVSALYVTPRNMLQKSIVEKYSELFPYCKFEYLFQRYKHCNLKVGGKVPCKYKYKKNNTWYVKISNYEVEFPCGTRIEINYKKPEEREKIITELIKSGLEYSESNGKIEVNIPLCEYEAKKNLIKMLSRTDNGIAVTNQGNFWLFRKIFPFVVIDECDETLDGVRSSVVINRYIDGETIEVISSMIEYTELEIKALEKKIETEKSERKLSEYNEKLNILNRRLSKLYFFKDNIDKVFHYHDKYKTKTYVEMYVDNLTLASNLFDSAETLLLMTATPPFEFILEREKFEKEWEIIEFDLPFKRSAVIYAPIENLSVSNIAKIAGIKSSDSEKVALYACRNKKVLEIFSNVVKVIIETYDYTVEVTGMKKSPIHCGNLALHGYLVYDILKANGRDVLIMEKGNQLESIEKFIKKNYDFGCFVSIEYGYDWSFSPIQYIVKVPYPNKSDPRIKALRKKLGEKFKYWYHWTALSRIIQACGRNCRRPDDFGVTVILDSTFGKLYEKFYDFIPKWFKKRLVVIKNRR